MVKHMKLAEQERIEANNDKMEEEKWKEAEDWADQMEELDRREAEEAAKKAEKEKQYDPIEDPANVEWMEKHIEADKEQHGEDFGEDLSIDFGSDE